MATAATILNIVIYTCGSLGLLLGPSFAKAQDQPVFSLHFTVDRMIHEKMISGDKMENYIPPIPKSYRYSLTYQVHENGDFFLEIFPLESPWETKLPHEIPGESFDPVSRILIKPGVFKVFNGDGGLIYEQAIEDLSLPEGFFSDGFDPLALRELLLIEENPTNRKLMLTDKGGIELDGGYISIQSCGQTGPLTIDCDTGVCSRVVFDPDRIRPIFAEHSKVGEPPFYVQYMKWSDDGTRLEKSFERELFTTYDGAVMAYETISHYHNFKLKD